MRAQEIIKINPALATEDIAIKIKPALTSIISVSLPPLPIEPLLAARILMSLADVHEFVRRHPGGWVHLQTVRRDIQPREIARVAALKIAAVKGCQVDLVFVAVAIGDGPGLGRFAVTEFLDVE